MVMKVDITFIDDLNTNGTPITPNKKGVGGVHVGVEQIDRLQTEGQAVSVDGLVHTTVDIGTGFLNFLRQLHDVNDYNALHKNYVMMVNDNGSATEWNDGSKIPAIKALNAKLSVPATGNTIPLRTNAGSLYMYSALLSGAIIQTSNVPNMYGYEWLGNYARGTKLLMRKFRGGAGDTIWHETVQGGEYRLATGNTDENTIFGLSNQRITHMGNELAYEKNRPFIPYDSTIVYGRGLVQFAQIHDGSKGTGLNGSTPRNPTDGWYSHMLLNHANSRGWYVDPHFSFNQVGHNYIERLADGALLSRERFFTTGYKPNNVDVGLPNVPNMIHTTDQTPNTVALRGVYGEIKATSFLADNTKGVEIKDTAGAYRTIFYMNNQNQAVIGDKARTVKIDATHTIVNSPSMYLHGYLELVKSIYQNNIGSSYAQVVLSNQASGSKTYLRKFRGGNTDSIWHETIQSGTYRMATGVDDTQEIFKFVGDNFYTGRGIFSKDGADPFVTVNRTDGTGNVSIKFQSTDKSRIFGMRSDGHFGYTSSNLDLSTGAVFFTTNYKPNKDDVGLSNVPNMVHTINPTPKTVMVRDTGGDVLARSFCAGNGYGLGGFRIYDTAGALRPVLSINNQNQLIVGDLSRTIVLHGSATVKDLTAANVTATQYAGKLATHYLTGGTLKPKDFGHGTRPTMLVGTGTNGGIPTTLNNGYYSDALWMCTYGGNDVKLSNVLLMSKGGTPRIGFRQQSYDAESWGTYYDIYHTGNKPNKDAIGLPNVPNLVHTTDPTANTVPVRNDSGDLEARTFIGRLRGAETILYGVDGLQWCDTYGDEGTGLTGSTPKNPTNEWYHHLIMNHKNGHGYYVDMAFNFHNNDVYLTRKAGGDVTTAAQFYTTSHKPTWEEVGGTAYWTHATHSSGTALLRAAARWVSSGAAGLGVLPYQPASMDNATDYVGTSSWWFKAGYFQTLNTRNLWTFGTHFVSAATDPKTYSEVRLPDAAAGSKVYLRKFRGGKGDTILHETVQGSVYRIAAGVEDTEELFRIAGHGITTGYATFTDGGATPRILLNRTDHTGNVSIKFQGGNNVRVFGMRADGNFGYTTGDYDISGAGAAVFFTTANKPNRTDVGLSLVPNTKHTVAAEASTVVLRDSGADILARSYVANNGYGLRIKDTAGSIKNAVTMDSHNNIIVGDNARDIVMNAPLTEFRGYIKHDAQKIMGSSTNRDFNLYDRTQTLSMYHNGDTPWQNAPSGFHYGILQSFGLGKTAATFAAQMAVEKSNGIVSFRGRNDGAYGWSTWNTLYGTSNKPTKETVGLNNVPNTVHTSDARSSTVVVRDSAADIKCRLVRSNYSNQDTIQGALAFRVASGNDTDNYIRFCSNKDAINTWLGTASNKLQALTSTKFTVGGDANTFYPVAIPAGEINHDGYGYKVFSISRMYNDPAPSTWNNATHKGGLTLAFSWNGDSTWGGNQGAVNVLEYTQTYTTICGGLQRTTGNTIVWLRGGGAEYTFNCTYGKAYAPTVYLENYTAPDGTKYLPKNRATADADLKTQVYARRAYASGNVYDNGERVYCKHNLQQTYKDLTPEGSNYSQIVGHIPYITAAGVMEVASMLDFHVAGSTSDYTARLQVTSGGLLQRNGNNIYDEGHKPTWEEVGGTAYWNNVTQNGTAVLRGNSRWLSSGAAGVGYLPYQPASSTTATDYIGTSTWWFAHGYMATVHTKTLDLYGTIVDNGSSNTKYSFVRLPTYAAGSKTYLRKFRGGVSETIWHETVQGSEYRLATGNSDDYDCFKVKGRTTYTGRGVFEWTGADPYITLKRTDGTGNISIKFQSSDKSRLFGMRSDGLFAYTSGDADLGSSTSTLFYTTAYKPNATAVGLSNVPNTKHTAAAEANTVVLRDANGSINANQVYTNWLNGKLATHYLTGGTLKPKDFGTGTRPTMLVGTGTNGGIPNTLNGGYYSDALMMCTYSGVDVKLSNVLLMSKGGTPRIGFRQQSYDSETWGTYYDIYHTGNKPNKDAVGLNNVPNTTHTTAATANTVPVRNSSGDIEARSFIGRLATGNTIVYGREGLQWTDLSGAGGTGGNGNDPKNPSNAWYHHLIMNHSNSAGYYVDMSFDFGGNAIYVKAMDNGTLSSEARVFTTKYAPSKTTVGLSNVPNTTHTTAATGNTVVLRDGAADIIARSICTNNGYGLRVRDTAGTLRNVAIIDGHNKVVIGDNQRDILLYASQVNFQGNFTINSDKRIKDNIKKITNAMQTLRGVNGVTYTRTDLDDNNKQYAGFIAQDLKQVYPIAVDVREANGFEDFHSVDYVEVIPLAVEAIKDVDNELQQVKDELQKTKDELNEMRQLMAQMMEKLNSL